MDGDLPCMSGLPRVRSYLQCLTCLSFTALQNISCLPLSQQAVISKSSQEATLLGGAVQLMQSAKQLA